jgi:regulator of protease activity HflC (stomatin/prohibitin superfamily)
MELLSFIVDVIKQGWSMIWPVYVIPEFERGLILRWGKYYKTVEPGLHIKAIFADTLYTVSIATETISTATQSLTTKDGLTISVALVIKYNVGEDEESLRRYLLKVRDVVDAIDDIAMVKTKEIIMSLTWEECKTTNIDNEITKKARVEAKKWGINIDYIVVIQLAKSHNIRLLQ